MPPIWDLLKVLLPRAHEPCFSSGLIDRLCPAMALDRPVSLTSGSAGSTSGLAGSACHFVFVWCTSLYGWMTYLLSLALISSPCLAEGTAVTLITWLTAAQPSWGSSIRAFILLHGVYNYTFPAQYLEAWDRWAHFDSRWTWSMCGFWRLCFHIDFSDVWDRIFYYSRSHNVLNWIFKWLKNMKSQNKKMVLNKK